MRTKIAIVALIAIILVTARISYVTLYPPVPPKVVSKAKVEALSGEQFLIQLGGEGQLPGFSPHEHAIFASKVVKLFYPYTLNVQYAKTGDTSRLNHYTIVQLTKDSEWQLKRAWQTDVKG